MTDVHNQQWYEDQGIYPEDPRWGQLLEMPAVEDETSAIDFSNLADYTDMSFGDNIAATLDGSYGPDADFTADTSLSYGAEEPPRTPTPPPPPPRPAHPIATFGFGGTLLVMFPSGLSVQATTQMDTAGEEATVAAAAA
jgi:hypothetical protein